mmetsp:Transcript_13273/g.19346  ORF Transcript_13273/g.19346 Transcript_13273/m.19346 type:complete len:187 (+) Transcript_13273:166-726(+)
MDVEEPQSIRQRPKKNVKGGGNGGNGKKSPMMPVSQPVIPYNHPVNILYRVVVCFGSLYLLHEMEVFHQIVRGPDVSHEWFKIGLAASVAIAGIKAYMEMYEGKMNKKKVEYQGYKNSTHAVIFFFLLATFAFHVSLWNALGGFKTVVANFLLGYGVLLQLALLVPTWVQNAVTFIALTFFIQQYQ